VLAVFNKVMSSFGFGGFARPKLEVVAAFAKSVSNEWKADPVPVKRAQEEGSKQQPCKGTSASEPRQKEGDVPSHDASPHKAAEPKIKSHSQGHHEEKASNAGPKHTPKDSITSAMSLAVFVKMWLARRCVTLCVTLNKYACMVPLEKIQCTYLHA
jgi:hypothetical protein